MIVKNLIPIGGRLGGGRCFEKYGKRGLSERTLHEQQAAQERQANQYLLAKTPRISVFFAQPEHCPSHQLMKGSGEKLALIEKAVNYIGQWLKWSGQ